MRPSHKDLRVASFRGVSFEVDAREMGGGRRGTLHEYPGRDDPFFQDMGRKARVLKLTAWTGGRPREDWQAARDKLIEALEREGAGDYVDPAGRTWRVVCPSFTCRDSTKDLGVTEFSIEFAEAASAPPDRRPLQADTRAPVLAASDGLATVASERFARDFSLARQPQFVRDDAARRSDRVAAGIESDPFAAADGALGFAERGFGRAERAMADPLRAFGATKTADGLGRGMALLARASRLYLRADRFAASPTTYALRMFALYDLRALVPTSRRAGSRGLDGFGTLAGGWGVSGARTRAREAVLDDAWDVDARAGRRAVRAAEVDWAAAPSWTDPGATPSRAREAANAAALADLAADAALAAEANVATAIVWESRQEAVAAREDFAARIDARERAAGDRGDDATWRALRDLRGAVAADIDARALTAPDLARIELAAPVPGLVLADRLYGDLDREAELIARNGVRHPLFAGAGALEVRL